MDQDTLPTTTPPSSTTTTNNNPRKRKRLYTLLECGWCGVTSELHQLDKCDCIMCIHCIDKVCITCQIVMCKICHPNGKICNKCKQCLNCCKCIIKFKCTECKGEFENKNICNQECSSCEENFEFCIYCVVSEDVDDDYVCTECSTVACLSCGQDRRRNLDSDVVKNKNVDLKPVTEICYYCKDQLLNHFPNSELERNTLAIVLNKLIDKTAF